MPLSDEERRRLEILEQDLASADPELNLKLRSGQPHRMAARSVWAVLTVLAGFGLVLTGTAMQFVILGVIGFILMGAGAYWFLSCVHSQYRRHHPL